MVTYDFSEILTKFDTLLSDLEKLDPEVKGYVKRPTLYMLEDAGNAQKMREAVDRLVKYLELTPEKEGVVDKDEIVNSSYDLSKMHPLIQKACKGLFIDRHYRNAILDAYVSIEEEVKSKSGSPKTGRSLMAEAFNPSKPLIVLNDLKNTSDKDEQEGFMYLFMGATQGIRNPKAHGRITQHDPVRTLEYLAFASLLLRRLDESRSRRTSNSAK